jgi:hypothetical protein
MTRFDRRELRNYVREAEAAPRTGFEKRSARDNRRKELFNAANGPRISPPDFRILKTPANSSGVHNVEGVAD